MAYSVALDGGIIRIRLYGTFGRDDLLNLDAEVSAVEHSSPAPFDRITVIEGAAEDGLTPEHVRELVRTRRARPLIGPTRSALVAARDAEYGFARMYEMLYDRPGLTIRVFRAADEAMAWLAPDSRA